MSSPFLLLQSIKNDLNWHCLFLIVLHMFVVFSVVLIIYIDSKINELNRINNNMQLYRLYLQ